MSVDNKYLQDQINALVFSVSQMANIINDTVNTNGGLNNVMSGLYGNADDLRKKYLMTYTGLSYRQTNRVSSLALIKLLTTPDLREAFVKEARNVLFRKQGQYEVNPSNKVQLDSSNRITITVEINNSPVSSSFEIYELIKEEELVIIYETLFDVNKRVVFNELGSMLNDFVKDPSEGTLDTVTFNKLFEGTLNHRYVLEYPHATVMIDIDDGLCQTLTWKVLRSSNYYKYKMPLEQYIGLIKDCETIRNKYDDLIETYCTQHEDEDL